jgi:uncharacterized damage-inducible protein DinB
MTVKDLQTLYDYSYWANRKIAGVASQLTPEQFTQSVAGSYGSIRNTMVHILSAEWGWLDRCGGPPRGAQLKADDFPTLQSVMDTWTRVEASMREFLSRLRDEDLARTIEFAIGAGPKHSMPLGELMHHAAVHAVHHRGQVALLLRALGYAPGNFDILMYYGYREKPGAPAARGR